MKKKSADGEKKFQIYHLLFLPYFILLSLKNSQSDKLTGI